MRILDFLLRRVALCAADGSAVARRDAALLRGMSERELADLGIGRSEIPAVLAMPDHPAPVPASAPVRRVPCMQPRRQPA